LPCGSALLPRTARVLLRKALMWEGCSVLSYFPLKNRLCGGSGLARDQSRAAAGRQNVCQTRDANAYKHGSQRAPDAPKRGESAGKANWPGASLKIDYRGTYEGLGYIYSKSPGFVSASSVSAGASGERRSMGVSGGSGERWGGFLASLARRTGCSSQFMRRARKGGKLW
jgi:hypothetical protein